MPNEPFDPDDAARFRPPDQQTQEELGGILERAFVRERGKEPAGTSEEIRRLHAMADDALRQAEMKLGLAREAEAAMDRARDLDEVAKWRETGEIYKREAGELRARAEQLRTMIG
jgi:hypothetical protein